MEIQLGMVHIIYLVMVIIILLSLGFKKNISLACIIGIVLIAFSATNSIIDSIKVIFDSFLYAYRQLGGTILIISVISGFSKLLTVTKINTVIVKPFEKFVKTPFVAYWGIGIFFMIISWFFWPSPAVALIGVVVLPVMIKAGLTPMSVAICLNIFGSGLSLSGDYVIQGAPKLTSEAAGISVQAVLSSSIPIVIVMGVTTTILAYYYIRKEQKENISLDMNEKVEEVIVDKEYEEVSLSKRMKNISAAIIVIAYIIDILILYFLKLQGNEATALIGGTSIALIIIISLISYKEKGLDKIPDFLVEGFKFGFTVFGPVIPIAAFFYMGTGGFRYLFGEIASVGSDGIVSDLGMALAQLVPMNSIVASLTTAIIGGITGLDGSGFSGLGLVGAIARLLGTSLGHGIDTLAALGQVSAIWVGGGALVPWTIIPYAVVCGVSPYELARKNMKPVIIGLLITTIFTMFLL